MKSILVLVFIIGLETGSAFVLHPPTTKAVPFVRTTTLSAAEDNRKRRVRRKSPPSGAVSYNTNNNNNNNLPAVDVPQTQTTNNNRDFQPRREDTGVSLKVTDVRDLVSGTSSRTSPPTTTSASKSAAVPPPRASSYPPTRATAKGTSAEPSNALDDSLQQLLLDAREMQDKSPASTDRNSNEEDGVTSKIRNAISTLVTVDFFVVCLFLLWFLAGIFCSAVLKDDTVQIAFNSNFQQLVQPALGILMIAAIADALFKQKEDEEE